MPFWRFSSSWGGGGGRRIVTSHRRKSPFLTLFWRGKKGGEGGKGVSIWGTKLVVSRTIQKKRKKGAWRGSLAFYVLVAPSGGNKNRKGEHGGSPHLSLLSCHRGFARGRGKEGRRKGTAPF